MSEPQVPQGQVTFNARWEVNPYALPQPVNQMMIAPGPDTSTGPDGLFYLVFGQFTPPLAPDFDENGVLQGTVTGVGTFQFSKARLRELRDIITNVLENEGGAE